MAARRYNGYQKAKIILKYGKEGLLMKKRLKKLTNLALIVVGASSVYALIYAMSTAFLSGVPPVFAEWLDEPQEDAGQQSAREALENLKKVMGDLRKSSNELTEELTELFRAAEANGGKIVDVNEIARQVLEGKTEEDAE